MRTQLLAALADQWWADTPWQPPLPVLPRLHAAVFSTPGSPGLAAILAQISDRGWSASLFLKEPPGPGAAARLRPRELLFLRAELSGRASPAGLQRERAVLNDALAKDLATYTWKVRHAREV